MNFHCVALLYFLLLFSKRKLLTVFEHANLVAMKSFAQECHTETSRAQVAMLLKVAIKTEP